MKFSPLKPDADFSSIIPRCPTKAAPGSARRMAIYRARLERGEHLHHPEDARRPTVMGPDYLAQQETFWLRVNVEAALRDLVTRNLLPHDLPEFRHVRSDGG